MGSLMRHSGLTMGSAMAEGLNVCSTYLEVHRQSGRPQVPPMAVPAPSRPTPAPQVAHKQSSGGSGMHMSEKLPVGADSPLEAALERLRRGSVPEVSMPAALW